MNLVLCIIICCCSFFSCDAQVIEDGTFKCLGDEFYLTGLPKDKALNWTIEKSGPNNAKLECLTTIYWNELDLPLKLNLSCFQNNYTNTRAWIAFLNWDTGVPVRYTIQNYKSSINKEFTFDGSGTFNYISCRTFANPKNIEEYLITVRFQYKNLNPADIPSKFPDSIGFPIENLIIDSPVVNSDIGIKTELGCSCLITQKIYNLIRINFKRVRCSITWIKHGNHSSFRIQNSSTENNEHYSAKTTLDLGEHGKVYKSILTVTPTNDDDFGYFSCEAELVARQIIRKLYTFKRNVTVELVQRPLIEDLFLEDQKLMWTIRSHQALEDIEVQLKQIGGEKWLTYYVPLPRRVNKTNVYKMVYEITDEKMAGKIYEVTVKVKNSKEWSSPSYALIFIKANKTTEEPMNVFKIVSNNSENNFTNVIKSVSIMSENNSTIVTKSDYKEFCDNSFCLILGCSLASCIFAMLIICCCVCKCKKAQKKKKNLEECYPLEQFTDPVEQEAEERIYAYVPAQKVSHYAARALMAANKKLGENDFIPPIPLRPGQYAYDLAPKKLPGCQLKESNYDYAIPSQFL